MEPAIKNGSFVLIKNTKIYQVGDIVFLETESKPLLKRITKIEGNNIMVEGDNKTDSLDSRQLGLVRTSEIIGKAIFW